MMRILRRHFSQREETIISLLHNLFDWGQPFPSWYEIRPYRLIHSLFLLILKITWQNWIIRSNFLSIITVILKISTCARVIELQLYMIEMLLYQQNNGRGAIRRGYVLYMQSLLYSKHFPSLCFFKKEKKNKSQSPSASFGPGHKIDLCGHTCFGKKNSASIKEAYWLKMEESTIKESHLK